MPNNYDDTALKQRWKEFWADQGIPWDKAPAFPAKRTIVKRFKKMMVQQDEEQAYSQYFINTFLAVL